MVTKDAPKLRFKGFTEEWEEKTLVEIAPLKRGFDLPTQYITTGNIPIIYSNGILNYHKEAKCKGPGLATGRSGTIGKFTYIEDGEYWPHNTSLWVTDFKGNVPKFIYYLYQTINIIQFATGSGVPTLNRNDVHVRKCFTPKTNEQTLIGNYFKQIDKLIETSQQKLTKLKNIKKACLEKMFPKKGAVTPEIRFKGFEGNWEEKKLGDCALIQRGGSPRPIEEYITNDLNGINWIKIGDVSVGSRYISSTKERIKPEGENKSRRVIKGDLILSNSMSFGRPYIVLIDGCIHDGWLLIRDLYSMFDLEYLLQLLSSEYMLLQYNSLASGGVVNNLNSELVQSTTALIPDKKEQTQIGTFFQNLDNLISKTEQQLTKLKNIKKACLEKMFVNKEDAI